MVKCFLFLILFFCNKLYSQDISGKALSDKYLMFSDTGYVIYTQPHFKGLFISTTDTTLADALKKNSYLPYFNTYNDDFRDFILKNDTIPAFIKEDHNIDIYSGGRLEQRSLYYFRAVITVEVSMRHFKYMEPEESLKRDFFLKETNTNKEIYLREYFRSYLTFLECVNYTLL